MILYLLKMIACSVAFYALYGLIFQKEKMLVFNRVYLLAALVFSFFIPLITVTVKIPAQAVSYAGDYTNISLTQAAAPGWELYLPYIGFALFAMICLVLIVRLVRNLMMIQRTIKTNENINSNGARIVLLHQLVSPHSFFNHIFFNKAEYESGRVEDAVMEHELAHVRQKHSWDILFVELLQTLSWFNPVIYLYKRSIKINHELLADAAVVKKLDDMRGYQHILLQRAGAQPSLVLASSFHFFTTKKRIIMLQKKTNKVIAGFKALLCLPLLALLVITFSERVYAQVKEEKRMTPPKIVRNEGITGAEMKEYLELVKKIEVVGSDGKRRYKMTDSESPKKIYDFIGRMSKEQIDLVAEQDHLPPPPPPPAPPRPIKAGEKMPPPPPPLKNEVKRFTPPKIVKDEEVQIREIKIEPVSKDEETKKFTPPKIVKDEKLEEVTVTEIREAHPAPAAKAEIDGSTAEVNRLKLKDPTARAKNRQVLQLR